MSKSKYNASQLILKDAQVVAIGLKEISIIKFGTIIDTCSCMYSTDKIIRQLFALTVGLPVKNSIDFRVLLKMILYRYWYLYLIDAVSKEEIEHLVYWCEYLNRRSLIETDKMIELL